MTTFTTVPMKRLLVANRGEIAIRVMRACRDLEIESVAIYGPGEERAPHVRYADHAVKLDSEAAIAYLDGDAVISAAVSSGADAIHPGYGFLSENGPFAQSVVAAGLTFVGPSANTIRLMGDKVEARRIAREAGVPVVEGTPGPVSSIEDARAAAAGIGYPIAVKAAGGGGGRGFRVARSEADLAEAFEGSTGEARRYFANPAVYLERYLDQPRHIEIQVFADTHGNVVSLGERDCSIQRRHQKLVEESPSPAVDEDLRLMLGERSIALAKAVDYVGAGTVEYLLDARGTVSFLEMNTRIQVEHPVTEMITGIDLVREQLRVAMGHPLSFGSEDVQRRGWAIECRINAEDAGKDFSPSPAVLERYAEPGGLGVRVDGAMTAGDAVMPQFDSMIAKVVTWGRDRDEAISRMRRALADFTIAGPATTIPFHQNVMKHPVFVAGGATTSFIVDHPEVIPEPMHVKPAEGTEEAAAPLELVVELNGKRFATTVHGLQKAATATSSKRRPQSSNRSRRGAQAAAANGNAVVSPVQGTIIRISVAEGETVEAGHVLAVVEAMKMENEIVAHRAGVISGLSFEVGSALAVGQVFAEIVDTP